MVFAQEVCFKVVKIVPKKYVLVYQKDTKGKSLTTAFRICDKMVQIDTNYDEGARIFTVDRMVSVNTNVLFSEILALNRSDFSGLEKYLDGVKSCDYTYPFIVEMVDGDKVQTFTLRDYGKFCHRTYMAKLLDDLEDYFRSGR
jgi:hypothetical protein